MANPGNPAYVGVLAYAVQRYLDTMPVNADLRDNTLLDRVFRMGEVSRARKGARPAMTKSIRGGTALHIPVQLDQVGGLQSPWFNDQLEGQTSDPLTNQVIDLARLSQPVQYNFDEVNALAAPDTAILDIIRYRVEAARQALANGTEQAMWGTGVAPAATATTKAGYVGDVLQGRPGRPILGLQLAIDDAGTYGGIARGTNANWKSFVDPAATALTEARLYKAYDQARVGEAYETPDLMITTPEIQHSYGTGGTNSILSLMRYSQGDRIDQYPSDDYSWRNIPVVAANYCPTGMLFMLNTRYVNLVTLRGHFRKFGGFKEIQDSMIWRGYIHNTFQLCVKLPNRHSKLEGITV